MLKLMIFFSPTGVTVKPFMRNMIGYICDDDRNQNINVTFPVSSVVFPSLVDRKSPIMIILILFRRLLPLVMILLIALSLSLPVVYTKQIQLCSVITKEVLK